MRRKAGDFGLFNLEMRVEYTEMENVINEANIKARAKEQKLKQIPT